MALKFIILIFKKVNLSEPFGFLLSRNSLEVLTVPSLLIFENAIYF